MTPLLPHASEDAARPLWLEHWTPSDRASSVLDMARPLITDEDVAAYKAKTGEEMPAWRVRHLNAIIQNAPSDEELHRQYVEDKLANALDEINAAEDALARAHRDRESHIRAAAELGMPYREIAQRVGLSFQRISQILAATPPVPRPKPKDDEYLVTSEAGRRLGVSRQTIRKWVDSGHLKAVKYPGSGRRMVLAADVERLREEMARSA